MMTFDFYNQPELDENVERHGPVHSKPSKKERQAKANRKYYAATIDDRRAKARAAYHAAKEHNTSRRLMQRFGITLEQYNEMLAKQGGTCAICGGNQTIRDKAGKLRRLAVDHDHKTGKVRQLLCSSCNTGIGLVKESVRTLSKMIDYIRKHEDTNLKTVTLQFTLDEVQALAALIDAGVKASGLASVKAASAILIKLEEAVAAANTPAQKENE